VTTMTDTPSKPKRKTTSSAACIATSLVIVIAMIIFMNHALVIWHLPGHSMEAAGQFQRGSAKSKDQPCPLQPSCPLLVDCGAKPGRSFDIVQHQGKNVKKRGYDEVDVKKKSRSLVLGMAVRNASDTCRAG
jgi:hypothetical protein